MGGEDLRRDRVLGEQPRGAQLHVGALRGRDLLIDGIRHQRMHESQRPHVREDRSAREAVGRWHGVARLDAGQRGSAAQRRLIPQHRQRPRQALGRRPQEPQAGQGRMRDRDRGHVVKAVGVLRVERPRLGAHCADELVDEQRVAGADAGAGVEDLLRGARQGAGHECTDPARRKRGGP